MFTLVGDLHIKPSNLKEIENLFKQIEGLKNDVIILGDIFDGKEIIKGRCLNLLYKLLIHSNLKFTFVVGNHDLYFLREKEHALEVFKSLKNVSIVDSLCLLNGLYLLPYTHDLNNFRKILSTIPKTCTLIGHQGISGFDYGTGYICNDDLTTEDFKDFTLVVMGHFHSYQQKNNIVYLGTPFTHSFGESNTDKYIATLNEKTNEIKLIPTNFRKHLTLEVDCDILYKDGDNSSSLELEAQNYYRIILTGALINIKRFKKIESPNIKFIERPDFIKDKSKISELESPEKQFAMWGKDIKKLEKEVILEGIKILQEVANE